MLVYQRVDFLELLDTETHSLTTGWTLEWRLRTPWRPRNHQQEIRAWGDGLMATTNEFSFRSWAYYGILI